MVTTKEYKQLPKELQEWINQAVSKIDSPSRRDGVCSALAEKMAESYKEAGFHIPAVLAKYGSAEEEAEKNAYINKLPDRSQWKFWLVIGLFFSVMLVVCIMTLIFQKPAVSPGTIIMTTNDAGQFHGGVLINTVLCFFMASFSLWKAQQVKRKTETLYAEYASLNSWAQFGDDRIPKGLLEKGQAGEEEKDHLDQSIDELGRYSVRAAEYWNSAPLLNLSLLFLELVKAIKNIFHKQEK